MQEITPEMLLDAYAMGYFPMAEHREDTELFWVDPQWRGVIPLDNFHVPKRLRRTVRQGIFDIHCDRDFSSVIEACAASKTGRENTWINEQIVDLYSQLFEMGFVHTVECWQDDQLVGGLYGVALRGAFFGESMFSHVTDASKVALVHLVVRLKLGGFVLLDTQFITKHLEQFGAIEIPKADYKTLLEQALRVEAQFPSSSSSSESVDLKELLQSITQTS